MMATNEPGVLDRKGGAEVWTPTVTPPIGHELTDSQKLACSFRILARGGFSENIAGHITWQRTEGGPMLVNPWGLWWDELRGSDICEVDAAGNVVAGRWDVTPAIHIHTELHRSRPDARVVIHNHPYHAVVLAALGVLPELIHQTASMFLDDLVFVEEYTGEVDTPELGADLASQIGGAGVSMLASHGVIVTGATVEEATYRAATIDRICRLTHDVLVTGRTPLSIPEGVMRGMKASLLERGADVFFAGATRRLLRDEPEVLD